MGSLRRRALTGAVAAALLLLPLCARTDEGSGAAGRLPRRIVSLAPSITETLFALGLGDRVVGVTSYCHYPPEADFIEEIGGYTDANLEKIVTLEPDVVILQEEHEKQRSFLRRYGIDVVTVDFSTVAAICTSFSTIGRVCGAVNRADSLVGVFDSLLRGNSGKAPAPEILLCVGRDSPGGGTVRSVYAAGAGTFYNDLILSAGGVNAFDDTVPQYPKLSREGIITVAPDIIIDVAPAMGDYECSTLVADWKSVPMVPAVRNDRVYCLAADYATIPGPRVVRLLEDLRAMTGQGDP